MVPTYGVVLVTAGSEAEALTLSHTLVQENLAACVNILPIQSVYTWENAVQQEAEWQLLIKTDLDRFDQLEQRIQALHSYEVPEVIALPITHGASTYLDWISTQTARS
ncbi:divalent-cation tolerance protein CutA [filamentous cyanobacterium CCP5]|nr:divalent-cation tolerance protein CutA [filamentous cyanobacterium CCP5]